MWPTDSLPFRRVVAALGVAALLITTPAVATASTGARATPDSLSMSAGAATRAVATLVDIRAARHPRYDRIVLEFDRRTAPKADIALVPSLIGDFSGERVPVPGRAVLRVVVHGAQAHSADGLPTVNTDQAFALPNIMAVRGAGDFEAVLTLGIGLAKRTSFHVHRLRNPGRIAIDVSNTFSWTWRRVYFMDASASRPQPVRRSVLRPIPIRTPMTGLLDRIFAGPTMFEQERGLRLVTSGATGFSSARVADNGVARLRLTGGCRRDGARFTIADSILPTLRRLPTVDWIKIYHPRGKTLHPRGRRDSLPACLDLSTGTCLYLVKDLQAAGDIYVGEFLVLHKAYSGRVAGTGGAFYSEWYDVRGRIDDSGADLQIRGESGDWNPFPITWVPAKNTFSGWTPTTYNRMRNYSGGGVPIPGTPCN